MNTDQILKVLKNERECITRQGNPQKCNRKCDKCDLCLPGSEILAVYNYLIKFYGSIQKEHPDL